MKAHASTDVSVSDQDRHVKVVAWYDNGWGLSNRVVDTPELLTGG
ncbi:hypothetical protein [Catenulispora pinisilvae]|nr:hypothetical protein [Catenulispora pinisilvae]